MLRLCNKWLHCRRCNK